MSLSFPDRVRLAAAYAEKKPNAVKVKPPAGSDEVTQFDLPLVAGDAAAKMTVQRTADFTDIWFTDNDGTIIAYQRVRRGSPEYEAIERIRSRAGKLHLIAKAEALASADAKLDQILTTLNQP